MHRLLIRQLRRYIDTDLTIPEELEQFVEAVDAAYHQADNDRALIERSLELTSQELLARNEQLRQRREELEKMVRERTAALENRNVQLQTAAEVARDASTTRNLDELLSRTTSLIHERFKFYHSAIYLNDERGQQSILMAASGENAQGMLAKKIVFPIDDERLVGKATNRGEATIDNNVTPGESPHLPKTRSEIALPLRGPEQIIGAINVHSQNKSAFDDDIVSVLQVLADQLAVAISNTRLLLETEQTLAELEAVSGQYTTEAWQQVVKRKDSLIGYRYRGIGIEPLDELQQKQDSLSPISGKPASKLESDASKISIPIQIRDQIIGSLSLEVEDEQTLPETTFLAESVAERMALALENARLLEETQQRAEQERLVAHVTAKMRQTLDVDTVIKSAVSEMHQALGLYDIQIQLDSSELSNRDQSRNSSPERKNQ